MPTASDDNIERLKWDHADLSLFHSRSYELLLPLLNSLDLPLFKFWWDQEVNEMKRRATISHRAWIDANRPSTGIIYGNRKKDKYAYRNKIRQGQIKEKQGISNSLHDALIIKNKYSFWKMWRNKFKLKNNRSMTVNGKSCDVDIANEFATSFSKACSFNSEVRNDELKFEYINMRSSYNVSHSFSDLCLTVESVDRIVQQLALGKAAGINNLTVEHIKYIHPIIIILLTKLFNLMLYFDYVPDAFGIGLTVPVPKGNQNQHVYNIDDYRGITLSPVISKIFEHCLLVKYGQFLNSSDCQFGFLKKHWCESCNLLCT